MRAVAGERDGINARRLGKYIGRHERRIEAGLRFEQTGERKGVALWVVGFAGFAGLQNPPTRKCHDSFNKDGETNPSNPPNPPDGHEAPGLAEGSAARGAGERPFPPQPGIDTPPWDDLDAWRSRLAMAGDLETQRGVAKDWAQATGAVENGHGFALPPGLRRGLALAELKSAARRCGLTLGERLASSFVPTADRQDVPDKRPAESRAPTGSDGHTGADAGREEPGLPPNAACEPAFEELRL
jgi:hypothetical protein